ncbi:phage portal protein [Lactobacillus sp. CBA3605]|uniref:phage portal protein n=1 Tax=Lactobacillus sp. CBA3605 TaxID=2099788 RepID=UPI000CFD6795|nr:phage portal protein [Lactobacillus sp. CBA3605]AVK60541.1 phage portal protein [Lactobacillus sp. CBA3605]
MNFKSSEKRGSNIAIDSDLVGDIADPSFDVINYAIDQQRRRVKRYDNLEHYYEGKQDIFYRTLNSSGLDQANEKIMTNHAKYITDMITGFTTGNPISISAAQGKDITAISDVQDQMDVDAHNTELEKDLSVFGCAYELLYLKQTTDETTELAIEKIDPRGCVLVTDDTLDKNPLFGIYYVEKKDLRGSSNGYLITIYTATKVIQYRTKTGYHLSATNVTSMNIKPHYFKGIPLIGYRNNEEKQGDFEQTISLIDAYNELQSDRLTDKRNFVDALLVLYGFSLGDDSHLKDGVLEAPGKGEDGVSVEWLTKSFDETELQVLVKSIKDDIHQTSYVPNMNDENFAGNISGEAMKYKLFGLLQLLATKQRYLTRGIRRRLQLIQNFLALKNPVDKSRADAAGATIQIVPNIPVNMADIIGNIKNADGIIPQQIALGWLPGTNNPAELIKMLDQEKDKSMKLQQAALGGDPQTDSQEVTSDDQGKVSVQTKPDSELPDNGTRNARLKGL